MEARIRYDDPPNDTCIAMPSMFQKNAAATKTLGLNGVISPKAMDLKSSQSPDSIRKYSYQVLFKQTAIYPDISKRLNLAVTQSPC